jgi:hypothetical protein
MFPWSPEFVWDAAHVAFFGAFYSVALTIAIVLGLGLRRARADARAGRTEAIAWRAAFEDLPSRDRACRHQLTGEAPGRVCENAFDCGRCAGHSAFTAIRSASPRPAAAATGGLDLPLDRLYHRGHCYVKPEANGLVTVGLDDLARRLVGVPDAVEAPAPGARLTRDGAALRLRARGCDVRLLSPVDGIVRGTCGEGADVVLRVDPGGPLNATHLLRGEEVGPWAVGELGRLQRVLGAAELGPTLADGGELMSDLTAAVSPARLDAALGEMFLDP